MQKNKDLGIYDFDDFAMELTSNELILVNGGACGGGYSGGSYGGGGSGSSSSSSSCGGGYSGSYGGGSCGGGRAPSNYGNCGGGNAPVNGNCGGGSYNPTIIDKITSSMEDNSDKKYNKNGDYYMCDNWVQEVLSDAGVDYNDYFAGDAHRKEVKDHIADLKSKGTGNYTTKIPSKAGVYVVFMDGTGSLGTLDPHCGILEVNSNGSMYFTHNSSSNTEAGVGGGVWTEQTYSQNNGTKLSGLAYSNFYFQEIKL